MLFVSHSFLFLVWPSLSSPFTNIISLFLVETNSITNRIFRRQHLKVILYFPCLTDVLFRLQYQRSLHSLQKRTLHSSNIKQSPQNSFFYCCFLLQTIPKRFLVFLLHTVLCYELRRVPPQLCLVQRPDRDTAILR